jgi:sugar phosphate isomerase/epimerase
MAAVPRPRTRIGTTSFVHSAGWLENVRRLAGRVDDVEILVFERPGPSGPSAVEVEQIAEVGRAHGLTFSVHAPLDLALASEDLAAREAGVEAVLRTAALTAPLVPHALVLHLDHPPGPGTAAEVHGWQGRAARSLRALLDGGLPPSVICVENLGAGLGPAEPLVEELGLSVALDVGHLARDGAPFEALLARHLGRTRLIHWHGVEPDSRDHRSLRHYPAAEAVRLLRELERAGWDGVLTIEVFREADLEESLQVLAGWRREAAAGHGGMS